MKLARRARQAAPYFLLFSTSAVRRTAEVNEIDMKEHLCQQPEHQTKHQLVTAKHREFLATSAIRVSEDGSSICGPDNIHPYILKNCANEISPILQVIFTQSLDTGILPSDWLMANVCPVYKKGNRTSTANYRPISLTSVCSKTMEHIIYHSIMNHLNSNSILIDTQHGFRSQHSCVI